MKLTILFPCDFFDIKNVDNDYKSEYDAAKKF